jgi:hypothetical protein
VENRSGCEKRIHEIENRTHTEAGGTTSAVVSDGDLVKARRCLVDRWVQKTKRGLASLESDIIQERDDGRDDWSGSRRAADQLRDATDKDTEEVPLRRYVGVRLGCISVTASNHIASILTRPDL